jgi:murein L,D-transpeptidase YafK
MTCRALFAIAFLLAFPAVGLRSKSSGLSVFKEDQLRCKRVRSAVHEKEEYLKSLFARIGLAYPPRQIFIRAFKEEKVLELWARVSPDREFVLIKTYDICSLSGGLGPKRREGDRQVPEGFYVIDGFNPASIFYLSLGLNYPNASDQVLGDTLSPGGDIFIHGKCVTIGCLPLTDEKIKEVYLAAVEARAAGQAQIPVHIFPARLTEANLSRLRDMLRNGRPPVSLPLKDLDRGENLLAFWRNLKEGYDRFEWTKRVPAVKVDQATGRYHFL